MTRLDLSSHSSVVRVPRLPVQPERTHELLMHLARVGAMTTEQLLRQQRLDEEAEKYAEARRHRPKSAA